MPADPFPPLPYPKVSLGAGDYTRRLLAHGGGLMLAEMSFEPGSGGPVHAHDEEQLTFCLSGEFTTEVGGVAGRLGPGDFFHAARGQPHGVRCLVAGTLIHAFTPQRDEYKQEGGKG